MLYLLGILISHIEKIDAYYYPNNPSAFYSLHESLFSFVSNYLAMIASMLYLSEKYLCDIHKTTPINSANVCYYFTESEQQQPG